MLDPRVLDWIEGLGAKDFKKLKTWVAVLTPDALKKLADTAERDPRCATLLAHLVVHPIDRHEDLAPLFDGLAPPDPEQVAERELVVELHADAKSWRLSSGEESVSVSPPALADAVRDLRLAACASLEGDEGGNLRPEVAAAVAALQQRAITCGRALAALLPPGALTRLGRLVGDAGASPAVLRLRVDGPARAQALLLPWEVLCVDGALPVGEGKLHLVREVKRDGGGELPEDPPELRIVAHVSAPEGEGVVPLDLEEASYRMARALDPLGDRARFTELGGLADLAAATKQARPVLLHFSGHGTPGHLVFEGNDGGPQPVPVGALLDRLRLEMGRLPSAIWLSCCYGAGSHAAAQTVAGQRDWGLATDEDAAIAIQLHGEGIPQVLGYFGPVPDPLAARVDQELFAGLVETGSTFSAVLRARGATRGTIATRSGPRVFPLAWTLIGLYNRGPDRLLCAPYATRTPLPQELQPEAIDLSGVERLEFGFIGRRRLLAQLRKARQQGERVLGLYGLGGLGKTAAMTRLCSVFAHAERGDDWTSRVLVFALAAYRGEGDPAGWLQDLVTSHVKTRGLDAGWDARLTRIDGAPEPFAALARELLAVTRGLVLYFDNAESLQSEPFTPGERVPWRSAALTSFFRTMAEEAGRDARADTTVLLTTRYRPGEMPGTWSEVTPCTTDEVFRMTAWFPTLRRLPPALRQELAERRLFGHPRAVRWVEELLREQQEERGRALRDSDDVETIRAEVFEPALSGLPARIDQDLALARILQRLPEPAVRLLAEATGIGLPVPLDVVRTLATVVREGRPEDEQVLRARGLLTRFEPGQDAWAVHFYVSQAVGDHIHGATAGRQKPAWSPSGRGQLGTYWLERARRTELAVDWHESVIHLLAGGVWEEGMKVMAFIESHQRRTGQPVARHRFLESFISVPWPELKRASWLHRLGDARLDIGEHNQAEAAYRESLVTQEKAYGTRTHVSFAGSLHGLANVLTAQGRLAEAEEGYRESIAIQEEAYGTRAHPNVGAALAGLASVLLRQGHYGEAEEGYRESIAIQKKAYGTRHTSVGAALAGLADVLACQGRYSEAEEDYRNSIAILEETYGTRTHTAVAPVLSGLADVLVRQGHYAEAEGAYRESVAIQEKAYGTRVHTAVATSLTGLANALASQGRYPEAEETFRESIVIEEKVYETRVHTNVAASLHGLANVLINQKRYPEAEVAYRESIAIEEKVYGTRVHTNVAASLHGLAQVLLLQGCAADAEKALREAIAIEEAAFGSRRTSNTIPTLHGLAHLLVQQGRVSDAEPLARDAWEGSIEHGDLINAVQVGPLFVRVLASTGRESETRPVLAMLASLLRRLPAEHPVREQVCREIGIELE
jgi:tetratricopeptide (TPR) repeat protein